MFGNDLDACGPTIHLIELSYSENFGTNASVFQLQYLKNTQKIQMNF